MEESRKEAAKDGITVPETLEEYCLKSSRPSEEVADTFDLDEDYYDYGDESGEF